MAAIGNMGPFTPANFKGSGLHNGVPTFVHQLPLTRGGIAGQDAFFGRVVSINANNPRQFLKGIPAGAIPFGILINEPIINAADPAMSDKYFEGRPATVATFGLVELYNYDTTQKAPTHGSKIIADNATGIIGFVGSATAVPAGYTQIPGSVYEVLTPNGVRVWIEFTALTLTSTALTAVASPVFTPAAGAVAVGTVIRCTVATAGAEIHYTLDGTNPTWASPLFPSTGIGLTAAASIMAIGLKQGMDPSPVVTAAYTIA